ncbi:MAG: tRNA pseudouridine(55) synthase TruB [Desulfococcaceae bacterium]
MRHAVDGILVVDKPAGISSARVVARVKSILKARKAGHAGTLDPFATGVMVCCIQRATKLSRFFLHSRKTYEAVLRLGRETDTQDLTGTVTAEADPGMIREKDLQAVFERFQGRQMQSPPAYSALKHRGVPLYKLARQGTAVQKPDREILISELTIEEIALPDVRFTVTCSAGTYVRTLAADIGRALGCGGHLAALKRTASGHFTLAKAVPLDRVAELTDAGRIENRMIPMAEALVGMAGHAADKPLTQKIMYGNTITVRDLPPPKTDGGYVKVLNRDGNLLAVLHHEKGRERYEYCGNFALNSA